MVKARRSLILLLLITTMLASINVIASQDLLFDMANLFEADEKIELNQRLYNLSEFYDMDILIVSIENAEGKSARDFADDFFDYGGYGRNEEYDGILLLIDLDNREIYISTSGKAIDYLNDRDIENILDKVFENGVYDGEFYNASIGFIDKTNEILRVKLEGNRLTFIEVIISFLVGILVSLAFFIAVRNKYKFKNARKIYDYQKNSIVNLKNNNDIFINKFITHRRIPKNNNTGGGGKTSRHTSSSGRTHGGGGRKF